MTISQWGGDFRIPNCHDMALELVCGADFWCNRHCRTSPVALEGFRGHVWPKVNQKPKKTKIYYPPYWPLLAPIGPYRYLMTAQATYIALALTSSAARLCEELRPEGLLAGLRLMARGPA